MFKGLREQIASGFQAMKAQADASRVTAWGDVGWTVFGGTGDAVLPGTSTDWAARAGDLWRNSAVMACLVWIADRFPEARLQVVKPDAEGLPQAVAGHALPLLLRRPDAGTMTSGSLLWRQTVISYLVNGNAYWVKLRSGAGKVVGLRYIYHTRMRPVRARGSQDLVDAYEYRPGGTTRLYYPAQDVIHFRNGRNPDNEAEGFAPLRVGVREIATDNEWATFEAAIAKNFGVPGVMLVPTDPGAQVTKETSDSLKQVWGESFTGDNRGKPMIATVPIKPERVSLTPEELALNLVRRVPETRICALLKVKPTTVSLAVGDEQRTYANVASDAEQSVESALIPLQRSLADDLEIQLLPELSQDEGEEIAWDYSDVRALQTDEDALTKRAGLAFQAGIWTLAEARAETGKKGGEDRYFWQIQAGGGVPPDEV